MKRIFAFTLVTLLVVSMFTFTSCSKTDLVVCNWGEYISNGTDGYMDVIAEFEKRFNVNVEYVTAESNETLYATLKGGSVNYDVIIPSDYMIEKLIQEGMLAELDFGNIPNFANIMDEFKNPHYDPENKYSVPYFWGTVGIIYNPDMYTEELTGWENLWSEGYENKTLMFDNPRDAFSIALFELGYSINTTEEEHWREAAELLKSKKFVYCMDQIFDKMPGEDAAIGTYYAGDCLYMMNENPKLEFYRPEYTNVFNDAMCVLKDAKHKELAEKFINFMLEPDVGLANTEYLGYSTPNQKVYDLLTLDDATREIAYPSISKKWERMYVLPSETEKLMNELWNEIKVSNK